jgi:3-isopropylmalate/(R)-2-methylmalate dehydratase large subunit
VKGRIGYAYEFAGDTITGMSMEERLTVCNMAIEGGARVGYINPDQTTVDYLSGRPFVPQGADFDTASKWWLSMASDKDASFADVFSLDGASLEPQVAWGINPGQAVGFRKIFPRRTRLPAAIGRVWKRRIGSLRLRRAVPVRDIDINVAFIGSCTNGRCRICAKRPGWPKGVMWPKGFGRWWCRGPKKFNGRPSPKG